MISVQITGLDEIRKRIAPARVEQALDRGIQRSAQVIRDRTKTLPPVSAARTGYGAKGIPVDTGRLRQSIHVRRVALMAADVFTGVNYGAYVHQGTRNVPPRPFFLWTLVDFGGKEEIEAVFKQILSRLLS